MATEAWTLGEILKDALARSGRRYQDLYLEYLERCKERNLSITEGPYKMKSLGTIGSYCRDDSVPNFSKLMLMVEILNEWLEEKGEGPVPIEYHPPLRLVGDDEAPPSTDETGEQSRCFAHIPSDLHKRALEAA